MLLRSSVSTWVDQFVPARPHPGEKRIWLRATGSNLAKRGFIHFNRPFEWGQTLTTVKLHMFGVGTGWGTRTVWIETVAAPGFDKGIGNANWNNQPGVTGATVGVTQANPADGTEWIWDLTARCQAIADAGKGWYGFRLTVDNDGGPYKFYSSRSPVFVPYLEVEVSDAPEQPTHLVPDGGVVSLQRSTFRMDFTDYSGDQTMNALQVQIDAANNFVSGIDFDTGTVATDVPEYDSTLATPGGTWAGLSGGASTWWRTRVRDGSNKWSPWSDPAQFTRQTKGTLTITNPPVSGLVTEYTPPITWTFTGTQTGYRVIIERVSTGSLPNRVVYDSEFIAGTATSHDIPRGVLTEAGAQYRVIVRVRDQYEREDLPGDLPFITANRTFTVTTGATTPVTGLAADALVMFGAQSPFVELTWTRATAPDSFTIERDGKIVEADLDPSEVLVSGTSYAYVDYGARANVAHTWKVHANVNRINSVDEDVTHDVVNSTGIWLYDNDLDLVVEIGGTDAGEWTMPETAATHYPANSRKAVRITNALHGWAGSFSNGLLQKSYDGSMTGFEWEKRMMQIKEHPNRPIWINAGDRAFRAILFDIVCPLADSPQDPRDKGVQFSFIQVNDFTFDSRAA